MDLKHFSHPHPLTYHQMEQPTAETLICYGCDLQIQHGPAAFYYTCWQCQFFLHDQCFRATRSLSHPSHSAHPLSLIPYPTYPCGSFICNTCNQQGTGFSYSCPSCDFDLHIYCALNTNNNNFTPTIQSLTSDYLFPPNHAERYGDTAHWGTSPTQYPSAQYPFMPENMTNNNTSVLANNIPNEHVYPPTHNQNYGETTIPYHNNIFPNLVNNIPNESPYPPSHLQNVHGNNFPSQNNYPPSQGLYPNSHFPSTPENFTYPTVSENTPTSGHIVKPPPVVGAGVVPMPQPQGVKHFSHEHLLNLLEVKEKNVKCCGCEKDLLGLVYRCGNDGCSFSLHRECFGLPRELQHKFHKEHPLNLLTIPPYKEGFTCNGCLKTGKSFTYHCSICKFDLHVSCAFLEETMKRDDHTHSLSLIPSLPDYKEEDEEHVPSCDVCQGVVDVKNSWFYLCQECDFGTHVGCVNAKVMPMEKTKEELLAAALIELQVLELKQRLSKLNADFTNEGANSMSNSGV